MLIMVRIDSDCNSFEILSGEKAWFRVQFEFFTIIFLFTNNMK
jgi:hypothetical protein